MGNNVSRANLAPQQDPKTYFQADLPKFAIQSKIGNGKFMKSWLMRVDGVPVTVKVYIFDRLNIAPSGTRGSAVEDDQILQFYAKQLSYIWRNLSPAKYPNLLPYQVWLKSSSRQKAQGTPVYLIRQYLSTNLYDRLSTRPFLHEYEKLWIIYQLIKCMEICHEFKVVHGDIKSENVMCTTWNWIVLTDFGLFKPTTVPDDDPTDFQYFFDTMGRRRCSIAPERFVRRGVMGRSPSGVLFDDTGLDFAGMKDFEQARFKTGGSKIVLNPAMDVFSLGCLIAEVFLDGEPLLDLPGMLKYVAATSSTQLSPPTTNSLLPTIERLDQEDSPARSSILKISNKLIRQVVVDMTQRDPERRLSVKQYRELLQKSLMSSSSTSSGSGKQKTGNDTAFPQYFESMLHPLFLRLHYKGITPDDRIAIICDSYAAIVRNIIDDEDEVGYRFFSTALSDVCAIDNEPVFPEETSTASVPKPYTNYQEEVKQIRQKSTRMARKRQSLIGVDDTRQLLNTKLSQTSSSPPPPHSSPPISSSKAKDSEQSMEDLIRKCRAFMADIESKYTQPSAVVTSPKPSSSKSPDRDSSNVEDLMESAFRSLDIDGSITPFLRNWGKSMHGTSRDISHGLVIIIQVIVSQFRSLKYPQCRVISLMLLARFGFRCSDDVVVQRIIPTFIYALDDANAYVRSSAIRCVCALLRVLQSISSYESNIFTNYIFPSFSKLSKDPEVIVRVAFAEAISILAETSKRFLDRAHLLAQNKAVNEVNSKENEVVLVDFAYDNKLKALHEQISRWIRDLVLEGNSMEYRRGSGLSSHDSIIKRAILVDMMRLCVFFGQESTMDLLLTQLLTFLNDQDWELRYSFCAKIAPVCSYLGRTVTSECVLPCIENALVDVEEKVIARAVKCLDTLVLQQLLTEPVVIDLVDNVAPLLIHPSATIRQEAIQLVASISQYLGPMYSTVFLMPKLYPKYFRHELLGVHLTSEVISLALVSPISRRSYRRSLLQRQQQQLAPNYPGNTQLPNDLSMSYSVISPNIMGRSSANLTLASTYMERESEIGFGVRPSSYEMPELAANAEGMTSSNDFNDDESSKLSHISAYLNRVAQEMMTKTKQWRNGVNAGTSMGGMGITLGRQLVTSAQGSALSTYQLDTMLEVSASLLPDHSLQSVLVPHQKYGVGYFPVMQEDARCDMIANLEQAKSVAKIRSLFGLITKPADAARTLQVVAAVAGGFLGIATDLTAMTAGDAAAQGLEDIRSLVPSAGSSSVRSVNSKAMNSHPVEVSSLIKRIRALAIPPLPPDVGTLLQPDERPYNSYTETLNISIASDAQTRSTWRPRESALAATLVEHTAAVNRIAVAPDQTFFVTASSDRTAKVWQIRGIDRVAFPKSTLTYTKHSGVVTDVVSIENSHSVASCSDDGSVHVWRVDIASNNPTPESFVNAGSSNDDPGGTVRSQSMSISGYSMIKSIDSCEGSIVNLQHFNNDMCSVLVYASQKGIIHGWDMRSVRDSFKYTLRPELGYPTSSTISPDRHWITVGTSKGYVALWDIRFNVMCKLWHHSAGMPIHRLACSKFLPTTRQSSSESNTYLIVASGVNETAVWSLPDGGDCLKCFRAVPRKYFSSQEDSIAALPTLRPVSFSSHPLAPVITSIYDAPTVPSQQLSNIVQPTVRSIIGRISHSAESFLMTGGSDRQIRFWDFLSPTKCYTVTGLEATQQKPVVEAPEAFGGKLFMSYDNDIPSSDAVLQSQLPIREGRGPIAPSTNFRVSLQLYIILIS
jgi:WD40 repeat protein